MTLSYKEIATRGVQGLTPYQPGKPIEELERELGITDSIKLASNENPLGPSKKVLSLLKNSLSELNLYPDGSGHKLRQRLADEHVVPVNAITLGNGSNDVLELVARAFLTENDSAVFSEYAFAVYPIVTQAIGARSIIAPAYPEDHDTMPYGHDLDAILVAVESSTKVIFIANPNNPTGTWLNPNAIYDFLKKVDQKIIVVLDEAYFEYMPDHLKPLTVSWLGEFSNLVITRTFSKIHALAGLRVGYAISGEEIADLINRVRQPFNVNTLAQIAACASLDDKGHIEESVQANRAGLDQLKAGVADLDLKSIPSIGNFLTIDFGRDALPVYNSLLQEGVIVRPVANYGLPNHLRITVGTTKQNKRALAALKKVLEAGA